MKGSRGEGQKEYYLNFTHLPMVTMRTLASFLSFTPYWLHFFHLARSVVPATHLSSPLWLQSSLSSLIPPAMSGAGAPKSAPVAGHAGAALTSAAPPPPAPSSSAPSSDPSSSQDAYGAQVLPFQANPTRNTPHGL